MNSGNYDFIGKRRKSMMSNINVTPMVDVMLVLLIIFMVAAPMMTLGMEVNLPKASSETLPTEETQTVLTLSFDGTIDINGVRVNGENLNYQVKQIMETNGSQMLYLKADKSLPYGNVAETMGSLRALGISNIGLVTAAETHVSKLQSEKL